MSLWNPVNLENIFIILLHDNNKIIISFTFNLNVHFSQQHLHQPKILV